MTGGAAYAASHLCNSDYYAEGEAVTGRWYGRGADTLGLSGAVDLDDFEAIRRGVHPLTGDYLRPRQSADRHKNGETTGTARNLYDFTVSAPKSLSVMAMEDSRLIEAHRAGVAEMLIELENLAASRIRKNGANESRSTSNLVISVWEHDASRELDPQIHSHLVAGNLTWDGTENRWKALDASAIYEHREYLTEVYRNAAARVVAELGYQVEDLSLHGKDNGFNIIGIAEETRDKFSQRSAQRDAAIAEFLELNGRFPSNNEIARLVRDTRPEKLTEISTPEVKAQQRARLTLDEARTLHELHQSALERGSIGTRASAAASLSYASEHVFERVSVATMHELLTESLRHGRGLIDLAELKAKMRSAIASGSMLTAGGEIATQATLDREREMVRSINDGVGQYPALGRGRDFVPSQQLRPEQRTAVLKALANRDLAFNVSGAAGTGKTFALKELERGLREARINLTAVAPSARAVQVLQNDGLPAAMTIARLLSDASQQEQLTGQVLLIDEAGMVSSQNMSELLKLAKDRNARIIFSGDTAQIKAVNEGDALRVLEREANLQTVSLREVRRQLNAEYLTAMQTLRTRPADGLALLEKMGVIREVDWRLVGKEVSRAYREAAAVQNRAGKERSVLVVARTHNQIADITHAIRTDRKAAGEIGDGKNFERYNALDWTEAQKKQFRRYQPGQVLVFHKSVKGVNKNEALEVVSTNRNGIQARRSNGQNIELTAKQSKAFGVFERATVEVAAGDKLLLQANRKDRGKDSFRAVNGELVTVASIEADAIRLTDGRTLPANYKQFTSGYAVTAHIGQGDTADFVVVAPDGMHRDLSYVALTRGREGLAVITSDRQALQESIAVSGDRQSAIELATRASHAIRRAAEMIRHGFVARHQQQANQVLPATIPEKIQPPIQKQEITHSGIRI